jgi:hypothetical protein
MWQPSPAERQVLERLFVEQFPDDRPIEISAALEERIHAQDAAGRLVFEVPPKQPQSHNNMEGAVAKPKDPHRMLSTPKQ